MMMLTRCLAVGVFPATVIVMIGCAETIENDDGGEFATAEVELREVFERMGGPNEGRIDRRDEEPFFDTETLRRRVPDVDGADRERERERLSDEDAEPEGCPGGWLRGYWVETRRGYIAFGGRVYTYDAEVIGSMAGGAWTTEDGRNVIQGKVIDLSGNTRYLLSGTFDENEALITWYNPDTGNPHALSAVEAVEQSEGSGFYTGRWIVQCAAEDPPERDPGGMLPACDETRPGCNYPGSDEDDEDGDDDDSRREEE